MKGWQQTWKRDVEQEERGIDIQNIADARRAAQRY